MHDAHAKAPAVGAHTNVTFDDATHLDLTLAPRARARRPALSLVLLKRLPARTR